MPISANGYLNHLRSYLDLNCYGKTCLSKEIKAEDAEHIVLSEKIEGTNTRRKVSLAYNGDAFAVRLDQGKDRLFHFLKTDGHPWGKRCDFVVFQAHRSSLKAFAIEFKEASTYIPVDKVYLQLKAAEAWVKSLNQIINAYVGETRAINLSKYVFTACQNPSPDLDENDCNLSRYPSIRHYLFDEVDGQNLSFLENSSITSIR